MDSAPARDWRRLDAATTRCKARVSTAATPWRWCAAACATSHASTPSMSAFRFSPDKLGLSICRRHTAVTPPVKNSENERVSPVFRHPRGAPTPRRDC